MDYAARPDGRLAKAAPRQHERYGAIDTSVNGSSRLGSAVVHTLGGTPIGGIMGWKHAGRAKKTREHLGGSPEKTPKDLKGRGWRNVGAVTGAMGGSTLGSIPGTIIAGVAGARGHIPGVIAGAATRAVGGLAGGISGGMGGHRMVRDSQIYSQHLSPKAQAKAAKKAGVQKAEPAIPLSKGWQDRLPAVLDAMNAMQEAQAMGMGDELEIDAADVLRLVQRCIKHIKSQGIQKAAELGDGTLEVLVKHAGPTTLLAFVAMDPEQQAEILGEGDAVLEALALLTEQAGGVEPEALAKRAIDVDRLMKASEDPDLVKFWAPMAAAAGRAAPAVASAVGRWSGSVRGYLGPRLSRLTGAVGTASRRMGQRISNATRGPAQGEFNLQGGGTGGMRGAMRRGWGATQNYGQRLVRQPRATLAATGRAAGSHIYANRGGYGIAGGMEVERRWGSRGQQ